MRSRDTIIIKTAALLLATLTIYWQDLNMILNEALKSELMNYILAVPFLLIYLLYRKRRMLKVVIPQHGRKSPNTSTDALVGLAICLAALFLYMHGSYTFYSPEYHLASLPLFVAGCILILFNYETLRALAFPIVFLLLLIPPPFETLYLAAAQLAELSSKAAYHLLKVLGFPVSLSYIQGIPTIMVQSGSNPLTFAIDAPCAGIYSLLGFMVFALFAAYITQGAKWKKVILFSAGFLFIYGLNILRIISIVLAGYWWGMEAAVGLFHTLGGTVLIMIGTIILFLFGEKGLKMGLFNKSPKREPCLACDQNKKDENFCLACGRHLNPIIYKLSRTDLVKILTPILVAGIIVNLQLPVFVLAAGPSTNEYAGIDLQSITGEQHTQQILPNVLDYEPKFIYRDTQFEEIAKQDASLIYEYLPQNRSYAMVWVAIEIADARSKFHAWEFCLVTYPLKRGYPAATSLALKDIQILENPPLIGRLFAFHPIQSNRTQIVLYWYEKAYFKIGSVWEQKHMKISLIAFAEDFAETGEIESPEEYWRLEKTLILMARSIATFWEPVKAQSMITLTIAQWGEPLTVTTMFAPLAMVVANVYRRRKEGKANIKVYNRLELEEEKLILKAVHIANKEGKATGTSMAEIYRKIARPIEINQLLDALKHAEEAGLVKREITNDNDEPLLIWKTQISLKD